MEIADYLKVAKRRLRLLIAVPVLAAMVTTALIFLTPTSYTSTAWVNAPAIIGGSFGNQFAGAQGASQYVSAFQAYALGPQVLSDVSQAVGVTQTALISMLTVDQDGASTVMSVTATGSDKARVESAARGVATATLKDLFSSQVELAKSQTDAARKVVDDANKAISAWESEHKLVNPEEQFSAVLTQINNLQQQEITLAANGNPAGAAAAKAARISRQTQLQPYAALLATYRPLVAARVSAENTLLQAQNASALAQGQSLAANPSKVVYVTEVRAVDRTGSLVTVLLPVVAASVFLAIALIFLLELLARGRSTDSRGIRLAKRRHAGASADTSREGVNQLANV